MNRSLLSKLAALVLPLVLGLAPAAAQYPVFKPLPGPVPMTWNQGIVTTIYSNMSGTGVAAPAWGKGGAKAMKKSARLGMAPLPTSGVTGMAGMPQQQPRPAQLKAMTRGGRR